MATYYWRGGAGTWNNTNTTNWATTSGGAGPAGPPTSADDVIFDANSDTSANFTVTLSSTAVCNNFTVTAPDRTITFSGTRVTCYGNFTMSATNTTVTSMDIDFVATSTGKTITAAGKTFRTIRVNGAGGEWTQQDAFAFTASGTGFTLSAGTWKTNNFNLTGGTIQIDGAGTKAMQLGSATVTLSNGRWITSGSSNFTLTAGTSTISLGSTNPRFEGDGKTYYNLSQTNASAAITFPILGANTFNNITITALSATGVRKIVFYANQTINGTFSCNGASAIRRVHLLSDIVGTRRTLTVNAFAASPADICCRDIGISGTASPLSGTRIGNAGNNTGVTATAAANKYWNLTGTVNFEGTGWALTDGGTPAVNNFPLPQDTIYFTNTGAMGTVSVNHEWCLGAIDMSARTNAATFNIVNTNPQIHGNLTIGTGITWGGTGSKFTMASATGATLTLDSNGRSIASYLDIRVPGGSLVMAENTTFSRAGASVIGNGICLYQGTLNFNEFTITSNSGLHVMGTETRALSFGTAGKFVHNGTATDYLLYIESASGYTATGNKLIEQTGAAASIYTWTTPSDLTESQALSLNVTAASSTMIWSGGIFLNLNTQGYTGTTSPAAGGGNKIYGNLTIGTGHIPATNTNILTFAPSGSKTLTSNGKILNCPITIEGTGTLTLADALDLGTGTKPLTVTSGTFNSGGFNISCNTLVSSNSNTRAVTLGSSTVTLGGTGTIVDFSTTTGLTLSAASSTILSSSTAGTSRTFAGGGLTWGNVTIGGGTSAATFTFTGANTFATLSQTRTVAYTIQFPVDLTTTVEAFTIEGSAGNLITLERTAAGSTGEWNIAKTGGGTVDVDYLSISNSNATPATLTWYAGANSTDGGNNTGWIFTVPPPPGGSGGSFFLLFN